MRAALAWYFVAVWGAGAPLVLLTKISWGTPKSLGHLAVAGMILGIAVTCAGVAMTVWHKPWPSSIS